MTLKYDIVIQSQALQKSIKRIINQTYKLLPMRQEGADWEKPLQTLIEQLAGIDRLILNKSKNLLVLICKLEGLFTLEDDRAFLLYRRVIFECLGLLNSFLNEIREDEKF